MVGKPREAPCGRGLESGKIPLSYIVFTFFFFLRGRGIERAGSGVVEGRGRSKCLLSGEPVRDSVPVPGPWDHDLCRKQAQTLN